MRRLNDYYYGLNLNSAVLALIALSPMDAQDKNRYTDMLTLDPETDAVLDPGTGEVVLAPVTDPATGIITESPVVIDPPVTLPSDTILTGDAAVDLGAGVSDLPADPPLTINPAPEPEVFPVPATPVEVGTVADPAFDTVFPPSDDFTITVSADFDMVAGQTFAVGNFSFTADRDEHFKAGDVIRLNRLP